MLAGPENSSIRSCKNVTRRGSKHLVMSKISRLQYVSPNICYVSVCPRYLVYKSIYLHKLNIITIFYYSFRFFWSYLHLWRVTVGQWGPHKHSSTSKPSLAALSMPWLRRLGPNCLQQMIFLHTLQTLARSFKPNSASAIHNSGKVHK